MTHSDQSRFDVRCEWGREGVEQLSANADVTIIVDVLSFCTSVDIAVTRGAHIYPYQFRDPTAADFAAKHGALLADDTTADHGLSLSPASLTQIQAGTELVLPSPNGSTLTLTSASPHTLAGALRNASAVAKAATSLGRTIAVIPAGEKWPGREGIHTGNLRPAFEDLMGAGAIIAALPGTKSPEAISAEAAFTACADNLETHVMACASGIEKIERDQQKDVVLAAALNASTCVPSFTGLYYERAAD